MAERFKQTVSSNIFLIRDGKILLNRRAGTGFHDGDYGTPGGHVEERESVTECVFREVKEELGMELGDVKLAHVMHRNQDGHSRVDFFFLGTIFHGEPRIIEPDKCDDLSWFDLNKLPKNIIPHMRQAIELYNQNIAFSEYGWDKK